MADQLFPVDGKVALITGATTDADLHRVIGINLLKQFDVPTSER